MNTTKSHFVSGEIIPFHGYIFPNSTIMILLADNYGNVENSTHAHADKTGYYASNLGIPLNSKGSSSWHLFTSSDDVYNSLQIMV